jgi:acyl-[acyl carrier protein]--UDP-N-acetylglucosamine O-acyltransferase
VSSDNKDEVNEVEIKIDWVDTPRGKVPTYESISKAIESIAGVLMEQDIRLESIEKKTAQQSMRPEQLEAVISEIKALRAEIKSIYEKIGCLEELLNEISEKTDAIDYLTELVERHFKTRRERDED